jgi:hypothetical protein
MSEVKVNKISPRTACGTVTLGDSGDTFTIPSGATITNAGTASGFGATGETSWDTTVKTTGTFTATAGVGYFLNTTGGIITVNLPAGAAGSSVAMADYAGTWQTNNVTVAANGTEKIGGVDADVTLSTEGQSVTFVYIDGTQGWVNVLDSTSNVRGSEFIVATGGCITCSGNDRIHKFTGPGTFAVTAAAVCAANNLVSYLVVAGGGGGGGGYVGGGGGAGGFRELVSPSAPYTASPLDGYPSAPNRITVSATPYPIAVGGGGTGNALAGATDSTSGNPSSFSSITSTGGGYGKQDQTNPGNPGAGGTGGSGGGGNGGTSNSSPVTRDGGAGNSPPTTPAQGFSGGNGNGGTPVCAISGGAGGGATVIGAAGITNQGGAGGNGATTEITASPVAYAGGGGGSSRGGTAGAGGTGGGGAGGTQPGTPAAVAGGCNTGGGGGGGDGLNTPGNGGDGVVIIRYKFQ